MPNQAEERQLKVAQDTKRVERSPKKPDADDKKSVDKDEKPPYSDLEKKLPPLNEQEQRIVNEELLFFLRGRYFYRGGGLE